MEIPFIPLKNRINLNWNAIPLKSMIMSFSSKMNEWVLFLLGKNYTQTKTIFRAFIITIIMNSTVRESSYIERHMCWVWAVLTWWGQSRSATTPPNIHRPKDTGIRDSRRLNIASSLTAWVCGRPQLFMSYCRQYILCV